MFEAGLAGFFLGASLIIAIGAQNAFVLRQGLLRRHVFAVTTICFLSDAVLIVAGVAGLGTLIRANPSALSFVAAAGAVFLFVYGALAFMRAWRGGVLQAGQGEGLSLAGAVSTCLLLTWANPHVYLDTVVLLGGLSARYEGAARLVYAGGAVLASAVWFYGLGYGARVLTPVFAKPAAWRILDVAIGLVMWTLAGRLVYDVIRLAAG